MSVKKERIVPPEPDALAEFSLTDETRQKLTRYADALRQWNAHVNLIGETTAAHIDDRHFAESLYLLAHLPEKPCIVADLGSGAGFPGLVLAIATQHRCHLIESDHKKAAFLQHVAMLTGCTPQIHAQRVEKIAPLGADVVTARACASIEVLCRYAHRHVKTGGKCLFLKGPDTYCELEEAKNTWSFTHSVREISRLSRKVLVVQLEDLQPLGTS